MKINPKAIYLSILFTFLVVIASNVTVAGALQVDTLTNVTYNVTSDSNPAWSPAGNEILFVRDGGLYKVLSNGTGETKLTPEEPVDYSWSPDGSKILYTVRRPEMESSDEVWAMNANGSGKTQLMNSEGKIRYSCTWFPSGSKIAYATVYDDMGINYGVIDPDGSDKHEFGTKGIIGCIAFSPDASKIAYIDQEYYIRVLNLDQKNSTELSPGYLIHQTQSWQSQAWSPNGSQIVYYSHENGNWSIYTININGTGKTQLTSDATNALSPVFSPDGSKIVFESDTAGNKDIWVMDADGKNKVQLTTDPASDSSPAWSPDGTKIAFRSNRGENYGIYTLNITPQKPVSEFSASPTSGKAPLNVSFTDKSTGIPAARNWSFGDGTYSTAKNPKHKYSKAGNYTVTLTATNLAGTGTKTKSSYIKVGAVPQKPVANFSSNITSGNVPLVVVFTDKSTGIPAARNWSFGDGTYSTAKNPKHKYSKAGNYTVTLTATNLAGTGTKTKYIYIKVGAVPQKPVANFSSNITSGNVPLVVVFTDKSTGIPAARNWSFGDGTYSTAKNPKHKYSKAGNYTVTLTVKNSAGSNAVKKSSYINIAAALKAPVAALSASGTSGKAPLKVQFTDKSTGSPTSWKWSFGDKTYSTQKNPAHTYGKAGKYTVTLTAKNAKGNSTKTISGYITVKNK